MKQVLQCILVLVLFLNADCGYAACITKPGLPIYHRESQLLPPATVQYLLRLTPIEYKRVTGKKMHFTNRLALRLYQWKMRKQLPDKGYISKRQRKLGLLSLIFGAGAFVISIIPIIGLLAVPSAIAGIVLGIISLKGNTNTNGILGICFGGVFILLLGLLIGLLILAFGLW